jgi:hypothetical protein
MTPLLMMSLEPALRWQNWRGSFYEALVFLRPAEATNAMSSASALTRLCSPLNTTSFSASGVATIVIANAAPAPASAGDFATVAPTAAWRGPACGPNGQLVAGLEQPRGHGRAHLPEPQKRDLRHN